MQYGDLGKRFVAAIIDAAIVRAVLYLITFMIGFPNPFFALMGPGYGPAAFFAAIPLYIGSISMIAGVSCLISCLYYILMEGGGWHATLGKKIVGIYVADENGNGITYSAATLRLIGKLLSRLTLGIGYIMCLFSETKQCLHDLVAKTYVLSGDGTGVVVGGGRRIVRNGGGAPQLVGIKGPLAGKVYDITEKGLIIGRDEVSCQVVLPATQAKVGRIHCFLTYNPVSGVFVLNDRNSTNGTYLMNGTKVPFSQPMALKSGERFYLATQDNIFEVR